MAKKLSTRTRFEIFKRDEFTCQYCGRKVPEVTLEVDHIVPQCEGGDNDPMNLLTSCYDCNRGKAGVPLDAPRIPLAERDVLLQHNERRAQLKAYYKFQNEKQVLLEEEFLRALDYWERTGRGGRVDEHSLRLFVRRLGFARVAEAIDIANARNLTPYQTFKYFCGVCGNWLKGL